MCKTTYTLLIGDMLTVDECRSLALDILAEQAGNLGCISRRRQKLLEEYRTTVTPIVQVVRNPYIINVRRSLGDIHILITIVDFFHRELLEVEIGDRCGDVRGVSSRGINFDVTYKEVMDSSSVLQFTHNNCTFTIELYEDVVEMNVATEAADESITYCIRNRSQVSHVIYQEYVYTPMSPVHIDDRLPVSYILSHHI